MPEAIQGSPFWSKAMAQTRLRIWMVRRNFPSPELSPSPTHMTNALVFSSPAHAFPQIRSVLGDLEFYAVGDGEVAALFESPDRLAETHQTWGLDRAAYEWRIDIFREPSADGEWVCRRDERIRLSYDELIEHTDDGIPYVRPEVALLFKAKAARPKDEDDLRDALPFLDGSRRRLLREWLELVHAGHAWLELVSAQP